MTRFYWRTSKGLFFIVPANNGWRIYHDDEYLDGPFPSAQAAAEDLAHGHSAWPSFGNPSQLGIPDQIEEWHRAS